MGAWDGGLSRSSGGGSGVGGMGAGSGAGKEGWTSCGDGSSWDEGEEPLGSCKVLTTACAFKGVVVM